MQQQLSRQGEFLVLHAPLGLKRRRRPVGMQLGCRQSQLAIGGTQRGIACQIKLQAVQRERQGFLPALQLQLERQAGAVALRSGCNAPGLLQG